MDIQTKSELIAYLRDFTTENRWQKINEVLSNRTRYLSVVMEDIYQPHNASAVLRSCDGFGIQDVHIIENRNEFTTSKNVTIGAHQWLTLNRYKEEQSNNTLKCFTRLKKEGYRVVVTSPHKDDYDLNDLPLDSKTALVFGTELEGVSETAIQEADAFMKIPMYGFSESFNISVSAAICLYNTTRRLRAGDRSEWQLSDEEIIDLQLSWLQKTIKAGDKLTHKFLNEKGQR
ncbi:TrmH family RNA methyltransferase [Balneola sp. MJW-20]|uniref:TrmH family RNA methyltransferase n=1 Tax=Gracilimonas aurantiaca TaxID=3234185 RepID=UPI0034673813